MPTQRLKTIAVDEFTTPSPYSIGPEAPLDEVAQVMNKEKIRHLPVVENEKPIGIISDRDLRLALSVAASTQLTAREIMTDAPYMVEPDDLLVDVAFEMSNNKIGSAIVLDENGKVGGIFTSTDALNALIEVLRGDYD